MKYAIVEVAWVDSLVINHGEWMDLADFIDDFDPKKADDSMRHVSIGYLVYENTKAIGLATSLNDQPDSQAQRISGGMVIPRPSVLDITVLRGATAS